MNAFVDDIVLESTEKKKKWKVRTWRWGLGAHYFCAKKIKRECMECKFSKRLTNPSL